MYIVDADAEEPIMLIDRHIGYDPEDGYGIDGPTFARELLYLDGLGKKTVQIWINSPGGMVKDGYDIYNAMLRTKCKVDTYGMGIVASIAAVLFQAGRNRIMCDYAVLMYHDPFKESETSTTADKEAINAIKNSLVTMVSNRSGMTVEDVGKMMSRTTYVDAIEAKQMGLCDSIQGSSDYNKKRITADAQNNAKGYWAEAKQILNNIFKVDKQMDLTKICNRLKLVPQANEEAILEAINDMENRLRTGESTLTSVRNQLTEANNEKAKLQGQITQLTTEKEAAETAAKGIAAEALVQGAAKLGIIKNDAETIAAWKNKATADIEGTKLLLNSIPVNKVANKIKVDAADQGAKVTDLDNAVALEMANIQNRLQGKK